MAILKNQEIWFAKLSPNRPDKNRLDPTKPNWNIQCRTKSKEQRKEWMEMGIKVRTVRKDPADEESEVLYYSINLRKNANKKDGDKIVKATPPDVLNGKNIEVDPGTIGNGSIANIRLFKREYELGGIKKVNYTLMGVQLIKHVLYVGAPMEEFDECETETIIPEDTATGAGAATDEDVDIY